MKCGLLGEQLTHSYSPKIHKELGDYPYRLFEMAPDMLPTFFKNGDFDGINVTIPYKKSVIAYCDVLSPQAQAIGAVNTIVKRNGSYIGHNTDYFGFASMLQKCKLSLQGKKALVLGSGGASATAQAVLKNIGCTVVVISRTGENNYETLTRHQDAALIVNTTPVGMYPNNGKSPVDLSLFPNLEAVLDMIYNPAKTQLLMDAEKLGLHTENGLWMLVAQAKESAEWFTGSRISDAKITEIYEKHKKQIENIILVGMPGCGKSTIGKLLATKTEHKFVDADAVICENAGISIPEIFARGGETEFRQWETTVLQELGKQSGLIIATGGGCVTKLENYPALHQNGKIVWIKRDISCLPTDGRPLSEQNSLSQMYAHRAPLYESFCDFSVENSETPEKAAEEIRRCIYENSCD